MSYMVASLFQWYNLTINKDAWGKTDRCARIYIGRQHQRNEEDEEAKKKLERKNETYYWVRLVCGLALAKHYHTRPCAPPPRDLSVKSFDSLWFLVLSGSIIKIGAQGSTCSATVSSTCFFSHSPLSLFWITYRPTVFARACHIAVCRYCTPKRNHQRASW